MKKLFAIALLFVIGFTNLFPVSASSQDFGEDLTNPLVDPSGNVVADGDVRYNHFVEETGGYYRQALDQNGNILSKELLANPPLETRTHVPEQPTMPQPDAAARNSGYALSREWKFNVYGYSIGHSGIITQDLTGDGTVEIVVSAYSSEYWAEQSSYWYVVRQSGPNTYQQVWVSDPLPALIQRLETADINQDGIAEIYVAMNNGTVYVYQGSDFSRIAMFTVKFVPQAFVFADLDRNGSEELLISDATHLAAYNPVSQLLLWEVNGLGGDVAVGDVDGDMAPEIVLASGYVLNAATRTVEWHYPGIGTNVGFGLYVQVGDIDGDGIAEIVGARLWNLITIFEADKQSPMWEIATSHDISEMKVIDGNGDARPDVVYGDGQWGKIYAIDGKTHQELWRVDNPRHSITEIAVSDVDGDHALELIWGSGLDTSGDYLFVADIATGTIAWQCDDLDGPLSAVDIGDVDDDGQMEIVLATYSTNSGYGDGAIVIFNAQTHAIEWQLTDIPDITIWEGIQSVRIGDVDQDGQTEFVLATANVYSGMIQIYDGRTHALERQSKTYDGTVFTALEIGDVDGDAQTEVIVGQVQVHSGGKGIHIIVFDGATAIEEWQSVSLDTSGLGVYDIELQNVDADEHVEIITSIENAALFVIDGVTQVQEAHLLTNAKTIASADLDEDGTVSIVVGRADGKVDFYNGISRGLEKTVTVGTGAVTCLALADIEQNRTPEWLVCNENRLSVYSANFDLLWRSADLGGSLGKYNQIPVGQIDQDTDLEIVVGANDIVHQFANPWSGPLALSHMTVSPKRAEPGDLLTFTIVITNQGKDPISLVQVGNPLPTTVDMVPNSMVASNGSVGYSGGTVYWNVDLEPGRTETLRYQVTIKKNVARAPVVNTAQINHNGAIWAISTKAVIPALQVFLPACLRAQCGNYADSFADANSGWLVIDDAQMNTRYIGEEYRILAKDPRYIYLVKAPTCQRQNYVVEVDTHWSGEPGFGEGIIFGLKEDFSQYYMLLVNTDQSIYNLYYRGASGIEEISGFRRFSPRGINHLKVTRSAKQITVEINGFVEGIFTDARISGLTSVGLVNAPYSDVANSAALFDNFRVTLLPDTPVSAPEQNLLPAAETELPELEYLMLPMPEDLQLPGK